VEKEMSMPRVGMRYDDVLKRCKRIISNPGNIDVKTNLINSLKNQCRLAEGEKASIQLDKELCSTNQSSHSLTGAGAKQIGWGPGKKLGDGKWLLADGKWVKVN
jgi:hypothetical protein